MEDMKKFVSWRGNFRRSIDSVLAGYVHSGTDYDAALSEMSSHFWKRFGSSETIKDSHDVMFFEQVAQHALTCAAIYTGKDPHRISEGCFELGVRKNRDYGSDNLLRYDTIGIVVRISDKLSRVNNLKSRAPEVAESVEDTLMDIFNYAVYAYMLSQEIWY